MKKKILSRTIFGAIAGLAMWTVFTVFAAYLRGDWEFPRIAYYQLRIYGNELNAAAAQCVCAMLIGMLWTTASLIYRETDWSLLKQTVVHCLVCTLPALGIAWLMHMIPRGTDGPMQYLRLFGVIYALVWIIQYGSMRKHVKQFNARLLELKEE